MNRALQWFCLLAGFVALAGCAHSSVRRPKTYLGGQYYGDAVHARDLKSQ